MTAVYFNESLTNNRPRDAEYICIEITTVERKQKSKDFDRGQQDLNRKSFNV